jgi:hypothetical protein
LGVDVKGIFPIVMAFACGSTYFLAENSTQEAASVVMFMLWFAASYVVAVVEESK